MLKVSLTGNYYSGQKEVSKIFENISVPVFDADLILKYLINYSKTHVDKIYTEFGSASYQMGLLNLQKFEDNKKWNKLIDIVEFDILKSYERFRLNHKEIVYTIFKYSYIFERELANTMDYNINCYRPRHYRKSDLSTLTFLDTYKIQQLLDNEYDEVSKNNKSDYVINNFITKESKIDLENKVLKIHQYIQNKIPQVSWGIENI